MAKLKLAAAALFGLMAAAAASPATAQDRAHNWMREYVQLRVKAMAERATGLSLTESTIDGRIVGGSVAPNATHRFQVGLLTKSEPDNFNAQFCGGTLVKANFIVTAAHCSDTVTASQVQVLTGTQDLNGTGVRRNVVAIHIHPGWNPSTFDNDVAVWQLATSTSGIPFATLASADPPAGTSLKVTGWGALSEGGSFPSNLRQVNVPLTTRANCNDANSYSGDITARMICAGFNAGGKDSCQGDSGGPLTDNLGAGFKVLTGIVSWGTGCAAPNLPGVYTRVSNSSIRNFIKSKAGI